MNRDIQLQRLETLLARVQERATLARAALSTLSPSSAAPLPVGGEGGDSFDSGSEISVEQAVIDAVVAHRRQDTRSHQATIRPHVEERHEMKIGFELLGVDLDVEMDPFQQPAIEVERPRSQSSPDASSRQQIVAAKPLEPDELELSPFAPDVRDEDILSELPYPGFDLTVAPPDSAHDLPPDSDLSPPFPSSSHRPIVEPATLLAEMAFGDGPEAAPHPTIPRESGRHRAEPERADADSTGVHPTGRRLHVSEASSEPVEIELPRAVAPGEFTADLPRPGSSIPPAEASVTEDSTLPYAYGMRLPDVSPRRAEARGELLAASPLMMESIRVELPEESHVAAVVARAPFAPTTLGDLLDATLSL